MEIRSILSFDFDIDFYESEVTMKGYCVGLVTLLDLSKHRVVFYDIVRLKQDLEDEWYIAEKGLIVLKELTKETMEKAIYEVWLDGLFEIK